MILEFELSNTHNYSMVFKIVLTHRVPIVDPIIIFIALKGSNCCVIVQFITHNSMCTKSQYSYILQCVCVYVYKEHFQHSNSHANLVNIVQNTNELYINASHNMESKTPQTISHNYIKIKWIKIIGSKTQKYKEKKY